MATAARSLDVARRATVYMCDQTGRHRGQGLLLDLDDEGTVVLTCHHVIAPIEPDDLRVRVLQDNGQLTDPIAVHYDAERSRPAMDAVVLRVDGLQSTERPLLHALNPQRYLGSLEATGLTYLQPRNFTARVTASTPLEIPVPISGHWPDPPTVYRFPVVFQLTHSTDARPGISGGVVFCEGGVLGLVHFARADAPLNARESYLVPLSVWAEEWPALTERIEIFIDGTLRSSAKVKRARQIQVGLNRRERGQHQVIDVDVVIAEYQPAVYIEREEEQIARNALELYGGVVIIGKPLSGKTRLAWQLLRDRPEVIVVIPRSNEPPTSFEASSFADNEVILFFDDLHRTVQTMRPLLWQERLADASGQHCLLICTTRDGDDWTRLEEQQAPLLDSLERHDCCVFISGAFHQGRDLSKKQGRRLAIALGIAKHEFERRFDGTPGSLVLDLDEMRRRYERLRNESRGDVAMSRLLDAAKLLYVSNVPYFPAKILRDVAEQIRGSDRISAETWEALQRRTQETGFGHFDSASEFQTYKPYLERCVTYEPSLEEIQALYPILKDDRVALIHYSFGPMFGRTPFSEQILREKVRDGKATSYYELGTYLSRQPGREAEAEQTFRDAIKAGGYSGSAYAGLGQLLAKQPGREAEAEQTFRDAISAGGKDLGNHGLGRLLAKQPGREAEAEQTFRDAISAGFGFAYYDLVDLLVDQPGREQEAERVIRATLHMALNKKSFDTITHGHANMFQQLGILLARQPGREAEAEQAFQDAVKLGYTQSYHALGLFLARQPGREAEAEQAFQDSIKLGYTSSYSNLGDLLARQPGREAEAEQAYLDAVKFGDSKAALMKLLPSFSEQSGREVEAEQLSRVAIQKGVPEWGYYFLGIALVRQPGREAEAEQAFREAIIAGNQWTYYNLGLLLADQPGRETEAKQALRQAIDAGVMEAYKGLIGLLDREPGHEAEAEEVCRAALQRDNAPWAHYYLGRVLTRQPGREAEAEQAFRDAIATGSIEAHGGLIELLVLQLEEQSERIVELERALRAAIDAGLTDLKELHEQLVRDWAQGPGYEVEAEEACRAVLKRNDSEWAYYYLGLVLARQPGREAEAESAFRLALDAGYTMAEYDLGILLLKDPMRKAEGCASLHKAEIANIEGAAEALREHCKDKN